MKTLALILTAAITAALYSLPHWDCQPRQGATARSGRGLASSIKR